MPREPYLYRHNSPLELYLRPRQTGMRGIPPPLPIWAIIFCISLNCLTSFWTSCWVAPEPRAILRPARVLQQLGVPALLDGHRGYHGLDPAELPVVYLHVLELFAQARDHAEEA